jgi:hypothetical protein
MNKQRIIYIALMVALLLSTGVFQQTLAAGNQSAAMQTTESILSIINKTNATITVTLTSKDGAPFNKVIKIPAHSNDDSELEDAVYRYEYPYCDDIIDGDITLDGKDIEMIIYPCAHQPTKFIVNNHLSEAVSLELLYGYEEYVFEIELGKNKVEVFSGNYYYNYDACNTDISGDVFIRKNGTSSLVLHSCEWFTDPARIYGPLNPTKYKLINHASFPIILTLIGPENYLVTVNTGVNRVKLVSGNYRYSYFLDYQLTSGSMYVPVNGTGGLTLKPAYVMSNGLEEGDDSE